MKIQSAPNLPPQNLKPKANGPVSAADLIGLNGTKSNMDVFLGSDEYRNIPERDAAKMLGHFVQGMQVQGFPWRLYASSQEGLQGKLTGQKQLSDTDALLRLQREEPVLFQPMRNMQLDLSADSIGAIAAAGAIGSGTQLTGMERMANLTRSTRVSPGSQGIEVRHGEPIEVRNLRELKLLYQMYHLEEKLTTKDPVGRAAQQLAYFNQQAGEFGWRFYQHDDGNAFGRIAKSAYQDGVRGGLIGLAVGATVGIPVGLFTRSLPYFGAAVGLGALGFGLMGALQGGRTAAKGKPLNTVQALDALLSGKEIQVQETQLRGIPAPIISKMSWLTDRGLPNTVKDTKDLERLFWMQNQNAKEDPPPSPPEKPKPNVVVIDQSQHYYQSPVTVVEQ